MSHLETQHVLVLSIWMHVLHNEGSLVSLELLIKRNVHYVLCTVVDWRKFPFFFLKKVHWLLHLLIIYQMRLKYNFPLNYISTKHDGYFMPRFLTSARMITYDARFQQIWRLHKSIGLDEEEDLFIGIHQDTLKS